MLTPDTILQSRYRIVRLLGRGGMGAVYEAIDERLGRRVALKQTLVTDEHLRTAFVREAKLLANLRHPSLPNVIDWFDENDNQFIVMEYIAGDDLAALAKSRNNPFPLEDVLLWTDELLDALHYLHTQTPPILHRDIKPANLKITNQNRIILLDFGLAKGTAGDMTQIASGSEKSIFGYTPQYAPLEQIQGEGTSAQSDLYALAASLYHLLTNTRPPDALMRATRIINNSVDALTPLRELNPQVPEPVAAVITRALALKPAARYASAAEMRAALREARHAGTSNAQIPSPFFQPIDDAPTVVNRPPQFVQPLNAEATTLVQPQTIRRPNVRTNSDGSSYKESFAPVVAPPKRKSARALWWIIAIVAGLSSIGIVSFALMRYAMSTGPDEPATKQVEASPFSNVPENLRSALPSLATIQMRDASGKVTGQASGVFVRADEIATTLSAINGATEARITPLNMTNDATATAANSYTATTVLTVDREQNLVVLKVAGGRGTPIQINDRRTTSTGGRVHLIGAKSGNAAAYTAGTIRNYRDDNSIEVNASPDVAAIGGAALDDSGAVIGIVTNVRGKASTSNIVAPIANVFAAMTSGAASASIAVAGARELFYDFRQTAKTNLPALTPEAKERIIKAVFPANDSAASTAPDNANVNDDAEDANDAAPVEDEAADAAITSSATGAFTAPNVRETAYFVETLNGSHAENWGAKRLAIFAGDKLVAAFDVQASNEILKTLDLNSDGTSELLLGGGFTNCGVTEQSARLVDLRGRKLRVLYEFEKAYEATCAAKQTGGSLTAAVIYVAPTTRGKFPEMRVDSYVAPCASDDDAPRPEAFRYASSGQVLSR